MTYLRLIRLTLEVRELDFLESVPPGHGLELGGGLSNLSNLSHLMFSL